MEPNRTNFPANSLHFFSIIFSRSSRNHRLRIPKEFIRQYGNILPNRVFLNVPNGAVWPVVLGKCNGDSWLEWQKFKEYYSIGFGYFLVFRYDGNSHFHVLIFGRSASEIEYPSSATATATTKAATQVEHVEYVSTLRSGKIINKINNPTMGKKLEKSSKQKSDDELYQCGSNEAVRYPIPYPFPQSLQSPLPRTGFTGKCQAKTHDVEMDDSVEILEEFPICQTTREKSPVAYSRPCKKMKTEPISAERECRVPKMEESARDDSVKSLDDFPPSQRGREKSLQPHLRFITRRRPKQTDKLENSSNHNQSTVPQANSVKPVKSELDQYLHCSMQKVGDGPKRCQHLEFPTCRKRLASDTGRVRALQLAKAFKSKNPFFMVIMGPHYIAGFSLNMPLIFAQKFLAKKHTTVTLQVPDGRTWSANYTIYPRDAKIQRGWNKFVQDNFLAVGDVCVFELINGDENLLEVIIFRTAEDANCCLLPEKPAAF
ncbi:unnamed protein product [Ilex paraguariensis]|uniref:TF-B3 domain-containing protein n=1 Tax=Ilex paraguariensis TaxID=185542 RepID=A0ABC8UWI1_9AQUA